MALNLSSLYCICDTPSEGNLNTVVVDEQIMSLLSKFLLNTDRLGASTTSLESLFQVDEVQ